MGTVSEDMDTTTDSSIIQKYVPGTSDAATQVPVIKKRSVHVPQNEVKFLVFRSHLLSLFTSCRSCYRLCTGEVA